MRNFTRRALLQSSIAAAGTGALPSLAAGLDTSARARKGRIHQSVCQWCYPHIPVDQLAEYAANIGLRGVDLLHPDEYEIPRRYGLVCTMGYAGGGEIGKALNRVENHAAIEQAFRTTGHPRDLAAPVQASGSRGRSEHPAGALEPTFSSGFSCARRSWQRTLSA